MPQMNMVQAINLALREEMGRDGRVVILGEDVGRDGGVFRVTEGLIEAFGPERVIDTPLSESAIVGATMGMAAYGLRPVAEIQFMGFIYSAMDQLFAHAARIRTRSRGRFTAPLVVRTPYGAGIKAPELHEESSEAFFCHMPGIKVVVPSGPANAKGLLTAAIRDPDPVLFLEPTRLYRMVKEDVPEGEYALPLGKARIALPGSAVTVVAWGSMLQRTMKAVEGYYAEVIDPMTLSPFDWETLLASVKKTGRLVIVHEAPLTGGFGAEIAATVTEKAILHLRGPVIRVAGPDVPVPLRGVRHAVARNVMASQRNTAFVTGMEEADITELWELRRRELGAVEARGAHLTFLPFFIKAVQHALREHPYLNAAIDDAAETIVLKRHYHFGIAVETPDGLMVPVIRDVDRKSIIQLAAEIQELGEKARTRTIASEELKGSTFTLTNYGHFGGIFATPIINWPDVAILGFGRISQRPWIHKGQIAIRRILPLSLTFDHRVTDGADAAQFLIKVVAYLEDPALLFIEST